MATTEEATMEHQMKSNNDSQIPTNPPPSFLATKNHKSNSRSERILNAYDKIAVTSVLGAHLLAMYAPFCFSWDAFQLSASLYVITGLFGICFSYHRNLAHQSFKVPKWLEYLCAYCGAHALQCGNRHNVGDLKNQAFYRWIRRTYVFHPLALAILLYAIGGFPYIVWGIGVRVVGCYHATCFVNSACHVWGSRAWNTKDLSRNNWWVAVLTFGEGWHNNHHAFTYSARQGLEWWQIDMTWYSVKFLETLGFVYDVKLPSPVQIQKLAIAKS
ncbi:Palmitoyl-monogalactosyldiacylglycerol delta-7 desaturase, chloroplastic [Linum grandiflorum]